MKCQKCGAALTAEHLYCDVCGAEYQIVPDFEPELEISMAQTLSDLSESIQEEQREADGQPVDGSRKRSFFPVTVSLILVGLLLTMIGVNAYQNSVPCISGQAERAAEEQRYLEAAGYYEQLRIKQPEVGQWYFLEASMYQQAGLREEALDLGMQALRLEGEKEATYELLLTMYLEDENYQAIHDLLSACDNEQILQRYGKYLSASPNASHAAGFYETVLEITLEGMTGGQIYYTLDGTTPDANSLLYQEPIHMGNGEHHLKAIYINPYGVASELLLLDFEIATAIPLAPEIRPDNGTYEKAGFITVTAEEGSRIYYSMDDSLPTMDSIPYEAPIPMPLGESSFGFVAYSSEGVPGEVTRRNYLLNIKTGVTEQEAQDLLVQQMIESGHILDKNGALQNYYGVHRYFYKFPLWLEGKHYYVFAEHYLENEINRKTGNLYAVEVMEGECFRLTKTQAEEYSLGEI